MRTLILSCNTGEGHNSCAKAIEEYYIKEGEVCLTEEALQFISPSFSRIISCSHTFLYKNFPGLFSWGYSKTERHPSVFQEKALAYKLLATGSDRLYQYIKENEFDRVICTHVFAALMVSGVIRKYKIPLVTGFVATDYTCYPGVQDCCLNYYFIPGKTIRKEFENANITPKKIVLSGIPVRQMFYEAQDEKMTKVDLKEKSRTRTLLLMCGSLGCGPMTELLSKIVAVCNGNWKIIVVCGRNERLRQKLEMKYSREKNVHIKGYVQNVASLMEQADLYITKPGGISISEAMVKSLPMLLVDAVAGCEEHNRNYLVEHGAAKANENLEELASTCASLMDDEESLRGMQSRLAELHELYSSQVIFEKMKEGKEDYGE